jgi:hypothetical protein
VVAKSLFSIGYYYHEGTSVVEVFGCRFVVTDGSFGRVKAREKREGNTTKWTENVFSTTAHK